MIRSVLPALAQAVVLHSCLAVRKIDILKAELQVRFCSNELMHFCFKHRHLFIMQFFASFLLFVMSFLSICMKKIWKSNVSICFSIWQSASASILDAYNMMPNLVSIFILSLFCSVAIHFLNEQIMLLLHTVDAYLKMFCMWCNITSWFNQKVTLLIFLLWLHNMK